MGRLLRSEVCRFGMPFRLLKVDAVPNRGQSPEEAARRARYDALKTLMTGNSVLLTAQHLDDQVETILLQMLRGSGLAGLSGMSEKSDFGRGVLYRPFLQFPRQSLYHYGKEQGLVWIEDPSNRDIRFDRNFLRGKVIPHLRHRWPAMAKTIARSGKHCAEAQGVLSDLAADQLKSVRHSTRNTLVISRLAVFKPAEQRLILRQWIQDRPYRPPQKDVIYRIMREVLEAGQDRCPVVEWCDGKIRRYRNELYHLPSMAAFDADQTLQWEGTARLVLPPGCGVIEPRIGLSPGISKSIWRKGRIDVRFRQGGEKCLLPGRSTRHRLKNIFQEQGVPPWVRSRIPLVYIDSDLAAVGDLLICDPFLGDGRESDIGLRWSGHELGWP